MWIETFWQSLKLDFKNSAETKPGIYSNHLRIRSGVARTDMSACYPSPSRHSFLVKK